MELPTVDSIPGLLRKAFEENGLPLPEKPAVTLLEDGRLWQIDMDDRKYLIRHESDALNVYEESRIHTALANPRRYRLLEELNVRPSVSDLRVVENRTGVSHDESHEEPNEESHDG